MKIHYYLGWFNNYFPKNLSRVLQEDIADKRSLAMISANPSRYDRVGAAERSWLDQAGILFEEYHLINDCVPQAVAQTVIQNASVIFLLGGNTLELNSFLMKYKLADSIKNSGAVVMGASAGAINMSAKWLCSKDFGYQVETSTLYDGIGLDDFSVLSHFDLENNIGLVQEKLSALSEELDIYASNKDCAVRIKGDQIDIIGDVYLFSRSTIQKLNETI